MGAKASFMDDLLREFLTETSESLDTVDNQLVRFEQDPSDAKILDNIFRLVHTIKGTCGFLGLPRLEALAHAGETLMGKFRDGMPVKAEAVTLILSSIDRIKEILAGLEATETEPEGTDEDLIEKLHAMAEGAKHAAAEPVAAPVPVVAAPPVQPAIAQEVAKGTLVDQVLERPLRPGEVSLDDLERAFRETETEVTPAPKPAPAPVAKQAAPAPAPEAAPAAKEAKAKPAKRAAVADTDVQEADKIANQSIRVNVDTLEHLMTMVSELVLTRNQLLEISRRNEDTEFKVPLQRLSNVTAELQEGVMKTRMQPIGNAWQKLPRIVRDLSGELGKQIELEMHGADTELDRQVLDLIKDPLTHMVRNSADHGLETPSERSAAGKPEQGTIRLSAYHEGGHIIICIADNGRGLNTERIKAKAIANGLVTEAELEKMTEAQIHKFIFAPGFSTAAQVTSVSGRGVGMDVVRTNIDQIGGTIDIKSVAGEGTSVTIKIPLTLAIVSALIVEAAGDRFAIPQLSVVELVRARANSEHRIERIKDTAVLRLRNKLLPLMHLKKLLRIDDGSSSDPENGFMVQYREQLMPLVQMADVTVQTSGAQPILVFADDGRSMGLVVDEIIDIVEERLHIEVAGSQDGILGSAVIKGQATEVIDVGHFLPMAFADWFSRKEMRPSVSAQSVLLVDDSAFFRNMLAPVLKAAGYRVRVAPNAQEGLSALRSGQTFDVVLTDIEMPDMNGFEFAETTRADQHLSAMPIIALSSMVSPAAIERGRLAGFHDYVAKFDRPGLIAALKEQTAETSRAA